MQRSLRLMTTSAAALKSKAKFSAQVEASAVLLFPCNDTEKLSTVFYNPAMQVNRDLSVAALRCFARDYTLDMENKKARKINGAALERQRSQGLVVCEALSASGLRGIRYVSEIDDIKQVVCNDLDPAAAASIKRNLKATLISRSRENVDSTESQTAQTDAQLSARLSKVSIENMDAAKLLAMNMSIPDRFDVIDLDPYGTPAPFLFGAVNAVTEGGMLMVTATDAAVLCGSSPYKCFAKYGAVSVRSPACHEMGLRILLGSIAQAASRTGRYIVPLASFSIDYYFRVFCKVITNKDTVNDNVTLFANVYQCVGCSTASVQPLGQKVKSVSRKGNVVEKISVGKGPVVGTNCEHCGQKHHIAGPMWSGPLHDMAFLGSLEAELSQPSVYAGSGIDLKRITSMLAGEEEENGGGGRGDSLNDRGSLETVDKGATDKKGTDEETVYGCERYNVGSKVLARVRAAMDELPDVMLYYDISRMANVVHSVCYPYDKIRSALVGLGYRVSSSHACRTAIKTDAPARVMWDIMRKIKIENATPNQRTLSKESPAAHIMAQPIVTEGICFDLRKDAKRDRAHALFVTNAPRWGPKTKANSVKASNAKRQKTDF